MGPYYPFIRISQSVLHLHLSAGMSTYPRFFPNMQAVDIQNEGAIMHLFLIPNLLQQGKRRV